jgi:tryptophan synthase beta chain
MKNLKNEVLNPRGYFGKFGGRFVPETLVPVFDELTDAFENCKTDSEFLADLKNLQNNFAGRKTPLFFAKNLTEKIGGGKIFFKNEGLLHTGAHKMNHCLGQGLLAKKMGKTRVIAETGAGQHGLATATMCAHLKLKCEIFMGAKDVARQRPNVFWMENLGAKVTPVNSGGKVLRDAINAAIRDLMGDPQNTHYLLGTVCGPRPYPAMNTFFQKIVGEEVRAEFEKNFEKLPDKIVACVGGGSNAMGIFHAFLDDENVELIGVEAGGRGEKIGEHAVRFSKSGAVGISEGMKSYFLQNADGQMENTDSISAGLDYSGVGPQHAFLKELGRVKFTFARDDEVLSAWKMLAKNEGIFPALESAHAVAETLKIAEKMKPTETIVCNLSGRGDKDLFIVSKAIGDRNFREFLKTQI